MKELAITNAAALTARVICKNEKTVCRWFVAIIRFLHTTNAPTEEDMQALPDDLDPPIQEKRKKTVVFFHDERIFQSNEDQNSQMGVPGTKVIMPKSRGSGIMISDFIDEHNGFLSLTA